MRSQDMEPGEARAKVWFGEQVDAFNDLLGKRITGWSGIESAMRYETDSGPQWSDPDVDCVQLVFLSMALEGEVAARISSPQQGSDFGLALERIESSTTWDGDAYWRERTSLPIPTGLIEHVDVRTEDSVIAEVAVRINGRDVLLVAGEVYDEGSLEWHRFDESVLVFADGAVADRVDWIPAREPRLTQVAPPA